MTTIQVKMHLAYGEQRIAPVCPTAHLFAELLNQKVLTRANIEVIKKLGYRVEVVSDQPKEL